MNKKSKRLMNMSRRQSREAQAQAEAQSGETENTTYYIHGPQGIHAQQQEGEWKWMLQDGLNSVRSVVDNNVAVHQSIIYDAFGNPIDVVGPGQTIYGYTGEPTDPNELVYLRNRYYNPNLGTFISQDPYEGSMNNPMSLNRYAYVQNNPVNMTDPSGMIPTQGMSDLMHSDPRAFAEMMNSGKCFAAKAPAQQGCDLLTFIFSGFRCPTPQIPPFPTNTPQPTPTPTPFPTPTDSPDVNPCTTRPISPVFGNYGANSTPHVAGSGYTDTHRAVDIVPRGAYENYPQSDYLAPDWSTRPATREYRTVYAIADGTVIYPIDREVLDAIILRLSDTWEFAYVHISPSVRSGTVSAGTELGTIISHDDASRFYESSDQDHLHLGLRNPSDLTQSLNPEPCLPGLIK
jgi:RHS repeat-associated protein